MHDDYMLLSFYSTKFVLVMWGNSRTWTQR